MNTEEAVKKISLTIDDKKVEVTPDKTVFQAAMEAGIFVPHYCYHPDLSIAGVCRMCLVEVDNAPKLQISCNTPVRDGMVVRTSSDKARQAQKGSLELHLINHPVDCPICDKAGSASFRIFTESLVFIRAEWNFRTKFINPKRKTSERSFWTQSAASCAHVARALLTKLPIRMNLSSLTAVIVRSSRPTTTARFATITQVTSRIFARWER